MDDRAHARVLLAGTRRAWGLRTQPKAPLPTGSSHPSGDRLPRLATRAGRERLLPGLAPRSSVKVGAPGKPSTTSLFCSGPSPSRSRLSASNKRAGPCPEGLTPQHADPAALPGANLGAGLREQLRPHPRCLVPGSPKHFPEPQQPARGEARGSLFPRRASSIWLLRHRVLPRPSSRACRSQPVAMAALLRELERRGLSTGAHTHTKRKKKNNQRFHIGFAPAAPREPVTPSWKALLLQSSRQQRDTQTFP